MQPSDERAIDGYGLVFCPSQHAKYILDVLHKHQQEQEELQRNPPPHVEPVWKEKPAGQYEKGSGI